MVNPRLTARYTEDPSHAGEPRLPGFSWLPNRARHLLISCLGEFIGTFLFLFFAFAGTQVANNLLGDNHVDVGTLVYISLAFGFSLAVNVWIFFRVSGGQFNPAVTVALGLIGAVPWAKVALLIIFQVLAGMAAAGVVSALFPGPLAVQTGLSPETSIVRGLFIEMFLTAQLVFCILMLAAEKHRSTFLAPLGIGLALFIAELAGVYFTGGSLNPARSFGPSVVLRSFYGYHWIYWLGPLLGSILAVGFYRLLKVLEYETANPGADDDGREVYQPQMEYVQRQPTMRHTTDGTTDEHDFDIRRQVYQEQSAGFQHPTGTTEKITSSPSRLQTPPLVYNTPPMSQHGLDGHRSRVESSESYRSGPSTESGVYSSSSSSSSLGSGHAHA